MEHIDNNFIEIESNNSENAVSSFENKGFVRLPVCEEDFEDFICGLLGEPQTIQGRIEGDFEINIKTIENLHHLLIQRINQQNKNKLIQFKAKIMYKNSTAVTLNSFDELLTYNEVKAVVPYAVYLSWAFLVKFEDKAMSEKQVIDIIFSTGNVVKRRESGVLTFLSDAASIEYVIKHTARSWGVDIDFLLSNHIKSLFKDTPKLKKFLTKHSVGTGLFAGVFVFLMSIIASIYTANTFTNNAITTVMNEVNKFNDDIGGKIDFIANFIAGGSWSKFSNYNILFIIIMIGLSIFLGVWVGTSVEINEPSYILINEESRKDKERTDKRARKEWIKFIFSVLVSILCSVVASYIFNLLTMIPM